MSFNVLEQSLAGGRPVRLYQFSRGVVQWLYNSSDRDIVHQTRTYKALAGGISDDGIRQGGETSTQDLRIQAPGDIEVAQLYRGIPPSDAIDLVIFDRHYADPDDDYRVSWIGEIQSVAWPSIDRCKIVCSPESVSMSGQGLRLRWERPCPHCIYERGCNVDRELHRVDAVVISMDGATITGSAFSGYPNGYFNAGYIEWSVGGGNYDRRAIDSHVGTVLTIFGGTSGIELNQDVSAFPGCDQTIETCNTKFGNSINYGGIRHLPGRSPFDGNSVF